MDDDDEFRAAALERARELQLDESIMEIVLKQLLQVYDNNWQPIAEHNFTLLVASIIEYKEEDYPSPAAVKSPSPAAAPAGRDAKRSLLADAKKNKRRLHTSSCSSKPSSVSPAKRSSNEKHSVKVSSSSSHALPAKQQSIVASLSPVKHGQQQTSAVEVAAALRKSLPPLKHDPEDISKGSERVSIRIINEHNSRRVPEDFHYISSSIVYEKASVRVSLSRVGENDCCQGCFGNCLSEEFPCSCSQDTGGVFPYTADGLLQARVLQLARRETAGDPSLHREYCVGGRCLGGLKHGARCDGHIVRRFIKECWSKCSCHKRKCGNRIVQQGVRYKLEVFWTPEGKGWGVRCAQDLPKGAFVCEFAGEILTNTELDNRNKAARARSRHTYPVMLDADLCSEHIYDDDTLLCIDGTNYGNVSRFINHRCGDANLTDVPVQIECPDRHYYHIAFFTNREVKAFKELTWDYNIDFTDEDHPIPAFVCCCGSALCRNAKGKAKKKQEY